MPPGWPGPRRQPPRRHNGNRSRSSLALLILVPALVIVVVLVLVLAHPFSHPSAVSSPSDAARTTTAASTRPATPAGASGTSGASSPAASASATGSATPSTPPVTERQAATSVDSMLAQSVSDRSAIITASNDVGDCGPTLTADPGTLDSAAKSRQALLTKLSELAGSATLPPGLITNLTKAWQASVQADQAYAQWANDEIAKGCVPHDTSDPGYAAADTPNHNATTYKTAFAVQWDSVAAKYGLTQYQQGQL